jgi:hypothetical protein
MGYVVATREYDRTWRRRAIAFVAAGPAANLSIVLICELALGRSRWFPDSLHAVSILHLLAAANFYLLLTSLLYRARIVTPLGPTSSDGVQLQRLLSGAFSTPRQIDLQHLFAQSWLAMHRRDLAAERRNIERAREQLSGESVMAMLASGYYLRAGADATAREVSQAAIAAHQSHDVMRAYLLSHLAWANVLLGGDERLSDADVAAAQAMTIAPWDALVQSAAAAVLLQKGDHDIALRLFTNAEQGMDHAVGRALCLCGMSTCAMRSGYPRLARRYARKARRLDPGCRTLHWTEQDPRPDANATTIGKAATSAR